MTYTAHIDTFAADNLPPKKWWPEFLFDRPEFQYPERLNCATQLLDRWITDGQGDRLCLRAPGVKWTYADLQRVANRIAAVLVNEMGLVPGNRVLLRAPNTPKLAACWFAVMKAGGIAVTTMPLLRAKELTDIIDKARISHALCDVRLAAELNAARELWPSLRAVKWFETDPAQDSEGLEAAMARQSGDFENVATAATDTCLIAFTSGTTGKPKGTMHFHRDVMAVCDGFGRSILRAQPDDVFIGSPPLAFTFGLGGLLLFPLHIGASTVLLDKTTPPLLLQGIEEFRASVVFTAPTAYRAMAQDVPKRNIKSLRKGVAAGEALPAATRKLWKEATGIELIDGIGSTEMLHIFISATEEEARPGATGKPVPGYQACVLDARGQPLPPGQIGRLAVKGPTGCRYLADERQQRYVENGWNLTGDTYLVDEDGYFIFQARSDDMIVSAGYNIAGPEVEAALIAHPAVAECAVIGAPDEERGHLVKAFVVLREGFKGTPELAKEMQAFVKSAIAPYKYPRAIEFRDSLPKTETGKLQRFRLRMEEQERSK
ncbi:MAG TPA: benzoate-CoA ligase family protein [Burkholderiaceae bacterium]|nr:benzoate-CoA ligase family protein [Burkholderiaceae bacterium]